jgi:hypothetical protein
MPHIQIQFRRDTSVSWTCVNPVLASGEMGIELDTKQFKIGDGTTRWSLLPYGGIRGPPGPAGLILPPITPEIGQVLTYVGGSPSSIQWRNQLSYNTTTVLIRASMATGVNAVNFNFLNPTLPNVIPAKFGSGFTSGLDTDTFSITMNTTYNMLNLPIITGTIAYWDNSAELIRYMQMKFGNSATSNSVVMTIEPTPNVPCDASTNYSAPLKLTVSGITANAFTSVGPSPLNYAILIYLQLNN